MAAYLKTQEFLGVDLENNHLKTYNGFLCMIQITTVKYETYLIDAVKLRDLIRKYLAEIFEDDKVTKVFHGCLHSDVGWLQRDFGIATHQVFDTQESAKKLKYPNLSLTHLWQTHCAEH